jgi:hypothetical protein
VTLPPTPRQLLGPTDLLTYNTTTTHTAELGVQVPLLVGTPRFVTTSSRSVKK